MGWWKSKVIAYQMLSCFCIFRNFTPSWRMAPLALLLLFSSYRLVGFMFFSLFFTSLTLLFSTLVFMWKHKAVPDDELAQRSAFSSFTSPQKRPHGRESVAPTPMHNHETVRHVKEREEEVSADDDDDDASSEVLVLSSSEECEVDHTAECSDGTISDEDSLIEIALPSGHFVGHNQREDSNKYINCSLQQKKRELSGHEALFNQQSLMELLAEFNEEENLIEIDIAMGSIKCSSSSVKKLLLCLSQALDTH